MNTRAPAATSSASWRVIAHLTEQERCVTKVTKTVSKANIYYFGGSSQDAIESYNMFSLFMLILFCEREQVCVYRCFLCNFCCIFRLVQTSTSVWRHRVRMAAHVLTWRPVSSVTAWPATTGSDVNQVKDKTLATMGRIWQWLRHNMLFISKIHRRLDACIKYASN